VVVYQGLASTLARFHERSGAEVYLLSPDGAAEYATDEALLRALGHPLQHDREAAVGRVTIAGKTYRTASQTLRQGLRLLTLSDVTQRIARTDRAELLGYGASLLALVIAVLGLYALMTRALRPVRAVVPTVQRVADGDLSVPVASRSRDEIGAIEAALAQMITRLHGMVAEEVRRPVTRTRDSTQEIEEIITRLQAGAGEAAAVSVASRDRARDSVAQAKRAHDALAAITQATARISDAIHGIAGASEEQSLVAATVGETVAVITALAQHTESQATETVEASVRLSESAHRLEVLLGRFRLS
jgi:methyl-accepting chemotaxis protein